MLATRPRRRASQAVNAVRRVVQSASELHGLVLRSINTEEDNVQVATLMGVSGEATVVGNWMRDIDSGIEA